MLDVKQEREYIQQLDKEIRDAEIQKAKIEQSKENLDNNLKEIKELMEKLGCTPETIDDKIAELENSINNIKDAIEKEMAKVREFI